MMLDQVGLGNPTALIEELREQIDTVDAELLRALAKRMSLVEQIGRHKQVAAIPTLQLERWRKLIHHRLSMGRSMQLSEPFIIALFELVHREAIARQEALRKTP